MNVLPKSKIVAFAIGQLGWSILSGCIGSWLVFFYQPEVGEVGAISILFIPQGLVVLGIATIIGAITALGRVLDAITDPWIASLSDRSKHPKGRRIPFMKKAAFPLALSTVMIFCAPINQTSWINALWLAAFVFIYYLAITAYCTPYNALIAELGHTQKERMNISTAISLTFIVGTAFAYVAPVIWGMFETSMGKIPAVRLTFAILAVVAFICLMVPVFLIDEKKYVLETKPSEVSAITSLKQTFKNRNFRIFVASDILYFIALTMFQTGLVFFVTVLLGLSESMSSLYFVLLTAVSLLFYLPINIITKKVGKKKMVCTAFLLFTIVYFYSIFLGDLLPMDPMLQGYILVALAAVPMAIFGILPQAMVADVAESDKIVTGESREGMFYAARTFAFKLGQGVSMLLFTAIATIGTNGTGYRLISVIACVLCALGGIVLLFYNEKGINQIIEN